LLLGVCGLLANGCEEDLRVPYIPPTLANWPQPYHGVAGLKVRVFDTGQVRVPEALLIRGGSPRRTRTLPVPVFLIEHPKHGLILFGTGLNPQPEPSAPSHSVRLPSLLGLAIDPKRGVRQALEAARFKAEAVRWLVLGDLRFDHTGAIKQFPQATVVVSRAEHAYAREGPSGYVPSDFDSVANWKFVDFAGAAALATFPAAIDLFGDGSCLLIDAPGFTPGTMAMLVRLPRRPVLLADDVAPIAESARYAARPAAAYDMRQWWENIWRLKRFKDLVPELIVLPAHDLDAARAARSDELVVHENDS
jgi:glyoxylase-like metal-dependent hydrolase (beta-lactamase superfamily II)